MIIRDITHDTATHYRLDTNERAVFFLHNRSGTLTFELTGKKTAAYIYALFSGKDQDTQTLQIIQKHEHPETLSKTVVRSVLNEAASFEYQGTIHISKHAALSDASQECRVLLLSPQARASSQPTLEIENDQVRCHHAATTSTLNEEQLLYLQMRGLSTTSAKKLLIKGFLEGTKETLPEFLSSQEKEKVLAWITKAIA